MELRRTNSEAQYGVVKKARAEGAGLNLGGPKSSGIVTFVPGYGPSLPRVGSSSLIFDRRRFKCRLNAPLPTSAQGFREIVVLSVVDQLQELVAALSLNKSQLAQTLRVSRPTIYDWFRGKEPNDTNMDRLHALLGLLARAGVSGATPLNARFVRRPVDLDQCSLLELLSEPAIDHERVAQTLERARALGASALQRRASREERLRALGFEGQSDEQQKGQLAKSVALQGWPKR